jgi:hypothetical protein
LVGVLVKDLHAVKTFLLFLCQRILAALLETPQRRWRD